MMSDVLWEAVNEMSSYLGPYSWLTPQIAGVRRVMNALRVYLDTLPVKPGAAKKAYAKLNSVLGAPCLTRRVVKHHLGVLVPEHKLVGILKTAVEGMEYYQSDKWGDDYDPLRPQIEGIKRMMNALRAFLLTADSADDDDERNYAAMNRILREPCMCQDSVQPRAVTPCADGKRI